MPTSFINRYATFLTVAAWTAFAALLRFWKLDHGAPYLFFCDEGHYVYFALNMGGGDLNPHMFIHPTFFFYLCFMADALWILWALATGLFHSASDAWQLFVKNPTVFLVLNRSVSAVFGTLTVPVTYWIGQRMFGRRVGFCGAFFLAVAYLHVQYSQAAYIDVTLTACIVAAFALALLAYDTGRPLFFALAGMAAGLAFSTKYNALPVLILGPAAAMLSAGQRGENPLRALLGKHVGFFALLFVAGFTCGTPYWVLDFAGFKKDVLTFWGDYKIGGVGHYGYEGKWNWAYYLQNPMQYGLGLPLEIAGIAGIFLLALRRNPRSLFFLVFPVLYFLIAGRLDIRTPRYVMPLVPFLCLSAAVCVDRISNMRMWFSIRRGVPLLISFAALIALPSILNVLRYNYLKTFPDTRNLAHEWIGAHVGKDQKILQSFYLFFPDRPEFPAAPNFDLSVFDTRLHHATSLMSLEEYRKEGFSYLVLDDWHTGIVLAGAQRSPKYRGTGQRYREFLQELDNSATLVATFSPYARDPGSFDSENIEFASRGLWSKKCLGPLVKIYRL